MVRKMMIAALLAATTMTAACDHKATRQAEADARAANFVPPSVMSRLDFGTAMERRFRKLDRDSNDMLSPTELGEQNAQRYLTLDRNGDGQVSLSEFSEGSLNRFDRLDINRDGAVTSEERDTAANAH